MKAREEMPLLRCALGPTGRPFGDGLHSVTASGTDGRKAVITRNWDMAGSTLKKPIRGRKMGVGANNKAGLHSHNHETVPSVFPFQLLHVRAGIAFLHVLDAFLRRKGINLIIRNFY